MTQVAPFATLLAAHTHLQVLDPIAGPVERPAEALSASDEVLVIAGGRPCYRPIARSAPSAPPRSAATIPAGSLSPGIPRRGLEVAARQRLAIAFPTGTASMPADELQAAMPVDASPHWFELTVQGAEAIVAEGMRHETGALAAEATPEPVVPEVSQASAPSALPPLRAHAGLRELTPHAPEHSGILSTWRFTVPPRTTTIRISSSSVQPDGDSRHLGVAIYHIAMDGTAIPMESPALVRGFHRAESGDDLTWRWTDGEALLILPPRPSEQTLAIGITNWHVMLAS